MCSAENFLFEKDEIFTRITSQVHMGICHLQVNFIVCRLCLCTVMINEYKRACYCLYLQRSQNSIYRCHLENLSITTTQENALMGYLVSGYQQKQAVVDSILISDYFVWSSIRKTEERNRKNVETEHLPSFVVTANRMTCILISRKSSCSCRIVKYIRLKVIVHAYSKLHFSASISTM